MISKFPDITLLITHYNRSNSLANLLKSFKLLGISFGDVVVSDDGSEDEHLIVVHKLKSEFGFKLVAAPANAGLGNNINKGQNSISTPYTLYIQEDFEPTAKFQSALNNAIEIMNERMDIDITRFYAYLKYPYLKNLKNGFSEMYIPSFALNYKKIYFYSDHPHLRRSNFFSKFGKYSEGIKGDKTEYNMCLSFIRNNGKGLFYNDFQSLFIQRNSEAEPSTMVRSKISNSNFFIIKIVRDLYRQIKYNYDLFKK
ncbi:glycosyl transferase family 2 [Cnuella takakiae]|nr:glycosyl transferase family 2 [Cnuella takakiae]